jgi:hypothetical protein
MTRPHRTSIYNDTYPAEVGDGGGNVLVRSSMLTTEQVRAELPWHQLVVLPEPETAIADAAAVPATARAIQSV